MIAALLLSSLATAGAGSESCSPPVCKVLHPRAPDVVLLLGHSLINGNGDDAYYGGLDVPAGVTYRHAGTTRTTWVAAPSFAPYLLPHMPVPCTIVVRGQGGATMSQIAGSLWTSAQADFVALGVAATAVKAVVVDAGENDTGTTVARDAFPGTLETLLDSIEDTYPNAEIYVIQIAGDAGSMTYATEVRASQAAVVAAEPARRNLIDPSAPGQAQLQTDRVHLIPGPGGGNDVVAHRIVDAW